MGNGLLTVHYRSVAIGTLAQGKRRVFANAGVGRMLAGRWADVSADDARVDGWLATGLVSLHGPKGEDPPEVLRQACCGGK